MLKTNGHAFYKAVVALQQVRTIIDTGLREGASDADGPLVELELAHAKAQLDVLLNELVSLGARQTEKAAKRLRKRLDRGIPMSYPSFASALKEIDSRLADELEDVCLLAVSGDMVGMFEATAPLFGPEVFDKFQECQIEIEEAGKCLALRRNKATIFHLMLAMEGALRKLGDTAAVTVRDVNDQFLPWGVILSNLKSQKIDKMTKGDDQSTWSGVHSLLHSVANAWRNKTMHPAAFYTDEHAKTVFDAVKGFMREIAPLV